ncbi:protein of unknown function [Methanoculleus bourgensis]|uniref:Uncharacterized protein n=1 Tax=Methanoculleus bourgensis TaxID=83986 RepID=A0A0X3BJT4_9EURY|nr:protein of unknown function [Methanoculleus bourgensis]
MRLRSSVGSYTIYHLLSRIVRARLCCRCGSPPVRCLTLRHKSAPIDRCSSVAACRNGGFN